MILVVPISKYEENSEVFFFFIYAEYIFSLQAICTESGLMALRERRMKVTNEDFRKSKETVLYRKNQGTPEGLYL